MAPPALPARQVGCSLLQSVAVCCSLLQRVNIDGSACSACAPGTYKNVNGSLPCMQCDAGWYQEFAGATVCHICAGGFYSAGAAVECSQCPNHTFSPAGSILVNCTCNQGFTPVTVTESWTCTACAPGLYKDVSGSSECLSCDTGSYSADSARITACTDLCPPGSYSMHAATGCSTCPFASNSPEGSGILNCSCNAGYAPKLPLASQWVSSVMASSESVAADDAINRFPASAVIGPPDRYPFYGASHRGWSPSNMSSSHEWLELTFADAVFVASVEIFETSAPGACTKVLLLDELDQWITVWSGAPAPLYPSALPVSADGNGASAGSVGCSTDIPCGDGFFCNFASGSSGVCERCVDCADCSACELQSAGEVDCKSQCSFEGQYTTGTGRIFAPALEWLVNTTRSVRLEFNMSNWHVHYSIDAVRIVAGDEGWVVGVSDFSSQYRRDMFAAGDVVGAADTYPGYGINPAAWTPRTMGGGLEWLELEIGRQQVVSQVFIYETNAPGYCVEISLQHPEGGWDVVWTGAQAPAPPRARIFAPTLTPREYTTRRIKVTVNTSGLYDFYQIDAVRTVPRTSHWCVNVTDSWCAHDAVHSADDLKLLACRLGQNQLLGPPNMYPLYGPAKSWLVPARQSHVWLDLAFGTPVIVGGVALYETQAPGALQRIRLFDARAAVWETVWEGVSGPLLRNESRVFAPPLVPRRNTTHQLSSRVRLEFNTSAFEHDYALDAVHVHEGLLPQGLLDVPPGVLQRVALVVQYVAAWCSVVQRGAV